MTHHNQKTRLRHHALHQQWVHRSMTDSEFGGPRFEHNLRIAKKAVDHLGGRKLREVLEQSGLGSHPEIVRAFWKVGRAMAQPNAANTNLRIASGRKSIGELFYPGFNDDTR